MQPPIRVKYCFVVPAPALVSLLFSSSVLFSQFKFSAVVITIGCGEGVLPDAKECWYTGGDVCSPNPLLMDLSLDLMFTQTFDMRVGKGGARKKGVILPLNPRGLRPLRPFSSSLAFSLLSSLSSPLCPPFLLLLFLLLCPPPPPPLRLPPLVSGHLLLPSLIHPRHPWLFK